MEPIQRLQKWIQQTFFGAEVHENENEIENNNPNQSTKNHSTERISGQRATHTYASNQGPSQGGPRITYQYAKTNGVYVSSEVKEEAKQLMQHRKVINQDENKKVRTSHRSQVQSDQKRNNTEVAPKQKREKFNNPDFKPTAIPSPIHGFRKVLPSQRTQLTLHEPEEEAVTERLVIEETYSESDVQFVQTDPVERTEEETHEDTHEDVIHSAMQEAPYSDPEENTSMEELPVIKEVEVEMEHSIPEEHHEVHYEQNEQLEQDEPLEENIIDSKRASDAVSDSSQINNERAKSDHSASVDFTKNRQAKNDHKDKAKPSVPFNVLMMPKDKQASTSMTQASNSYTSPSIQLLRFPEVKQEKDTGWMEEQAILLEETLQSFHVDAKVVHTTMGPSVTRFEIQPARGVKVNKVTNLSDDIKMALSAKEIRIEAPIPGKNTIGIEVPNQISEAVWLREILRRDVFIQPTSPMTVALGLDISGQPIVTDLRKMPHGLVAGATGSGKSVCINSILISLLYKATPDEVKLLLVDPKMVELAPYNDVPHLVAPVITDAKQATIALKWAVAEMERRYEQFSEKGVRDVSRYNELYSEQPDKPAMPYILVVIDELADLMMVSPQEVEDSICRIAQKARACGIHLLVATQRPSVDVITGLIKANIPTRIAFSVSSQTDSRTILDMNGAERLLGRGDMLFSENGSPKPVRVQGTFVTDEEIEDVISYVKKQRKPEFLLDVEQMQKSVEHTEQEDDLFEEACYHVINQGTASASNLQRRFRIGYNRAARLIDMLEARGVITGAMGSKPRQVLVDELSIDEILS
ncbi:DNA translocase FtsK [Alkalicoccobacillus porphyridii]|uniref:DNA translocase FtsK n=1 Tax=Alkalicoccobacillus porphyridii TaxID=2597270 RepID=A0A554A321_9BACI|nr:DNA translocase FtsK [Alkalicoccobacillus porphyridii]TSB48093.1 DNA translocase FtsK [Alkalicoccobacillus porphyridii]